MAVTEQKKRGRGRPKGSTNQKKAETKKKVEQLLEGIPLNKKTAAEKNVVEAKPQPKDNDFDFVLEQLDAANLRIKELEDQVVHYKSSYEKATSNGGNEGVLVQKLQSFFNDLVKRDQARAQFGGAVVKLNYTGPVSQGNAMGLLQEMLQRFPFLKG